MKRFGFTIIELLVVFAIVAFTTSLLMPALHTARLQAKTVVCSSNIKQILNLLTIYEQQNGTYPYGIEEIDESVLFTLGSTKDYFGDRSYDKIGKWWFQYLDYAPNPKARNNSIFWCPSRCIKDSTLKQNILCGNYGVNRSICKDVNGLVGTPGSEYVGTPLSSFQIPRPESTLLVVDSGYSLISWQGVTNANISRLEESRRKREKSFYVPGIEANKQRELLPSNKDDAIKGRHIRNTVNVGYVDNHTKRLKAEELFVPEENGVYKNIYQTWIPK